MKKEILIHEIESMIRSLDFIQEEQSFIKHKLSSLLDNLVMNDLLEWSEELHQEILNRETAVKLLKRDVIKLTNLIKSKKDINDLIEPNVVSTYKKYKQQVSYFESQFFIWKNNVNVQFDRVLN